LNPATPEDADAGIHRVHKRSIEVPFETMPSRIRQFAGVTLMNVGAKSLIKLHPVLRYILESPALGTNHHTPNSFVYLALVSSVCASTGVAAHQLDRGERRAAELWL
jgi:hypothetical protein